MVTEQEMKERFAHYSESEKQKVSYQVTSDEMRKFDKNKELPFMIAEKKMENDKAHGVKATPGYDKIEEMCLISITSLKKTINGTDRPTRTFLYRFAVGLHMSIEEANKYFDLCGGVLREESPEDYLCIRALQMEDEIHLFCEQYEMYIGKKLAR